MEENGSCYIRPAKPEEWDDAMSLAWRTFQKFEADDYTKEGIESFLDFITDNSLRKMFLMGNYKMFVALEAEQVIGLISLRACNHISLLFVDEKYHKKGIGRALIDYAAEYVLNREKRLFCTVNAAPYAVGFYHRVGFTDTAEETENTGIRYTPMVLNIQGKKKNG